MFMDSNISYVEFPVKGEFERLIKEDFTLLWRSTGFSSGPQEALRGNTSGGFRPNLGRSELPSGTCCFQSERKGKELA